MAEAVDLKAIGTRPIRPDGVDKVTGRANFGADMTLPGMVHAKVLRSPYAHARIKNVDLSKALEMDGVFAAICGRDLPEEGANDLSINILARDKALYHGHAVAAVAARTPALAEQALDLIEVDYEELHPVLSIDDAIADGATLVNENMYTNGDRSQPPSNVAAKQKFERGDVEKGFAEADVVVEESYRVPTAHQGYIEPHACIATINEAGRATVWCCTQGQFDVRSMTAGVLNKKVSDIKVIPSEIGGGFGGKTTIYLEPVAVKLSEISGRPVKMVMNREEVFRATGPTSATLCRIKVGAKNDGTITAATAWLAYEAGAFPGAPVGPGCMSVLAPYNLENLLIEGLDVVVNKPKVAAYRAPGAPQSMHAMECTIDEVARKIGMDPIDLRLKNAADEGTVAPYGPRFPAIGLVECLKAAREHPNYLSEKGEGVGRGVAVGFWFNIGMQSSAEVRIAENGAVTIMEGSPDIGGSRASMCLMAAETLGVSYETINAHVGDTEATGFCNVTGGSRTTFATGLAVVQACEDIIAQCKERAALTWDLDVDQVDWEDGKAVPKPGVNADVQPLSLADIARSAGRTGGPLLGRASLNAQGPGASFSVNWTDVTLDRDTGKVDVLAFTAVQDAGRAIHPAYVEGQMQGGAVQGLGWALNEEYIYDQKGVMENAGFLDYRVPVASDMPMIECQIVEVPNPSHPYGVRGVGETPIVAPLAATSNAVRDVLGYRINDLPLSPPRVLASLDESN
ncbi:MAG: xanthine dehydrogenase family protein molybdopterin-binding subunit [Gammaproteobacteria bacterium]|nr:xanthine dehydrogenase family protein molybdopterin-binding subunit [Gammaproteobacteria bacterium]MYD79450.1 xanthine dehydrogenase family protein molybdopterin-binding subunit [Gammaproteobacteria bacterium]